MFTIKELMAQPLFRTFRLAAGKSGLGNDITGTGILEYETPESMSSHFLRGTFVLTTLSGISDSPEKISASLRALIDIGVSAISVKTVAVRSVPREVLDYADEHHIPLFYFSDTYFDDIIFAVKSKLSVKNANLDKIRALRSSDNPDEHIDIISTLDPFFDEKCICCCCVARDDISKDDYARAYVELIAVNSTERHAAYRLVDCKHCVMLIFTGPKNADNLYEQALQLFSENFLNPGLFRIGVSELHPTKELRAALDEATAAAYYAVIYKESTAHFCEIGIEKIVIPNMHTKWEKDYYETIRSRIEEYDRTHTSNLHETLLCYIECGGSISLTSQKLFQHENTIRYRLDKMKNLLGITDHNTSYMQLFVYVTLHRLYRLFDGEDII